MYRLVLSSSEGAFLIRWLVLKWVKERGTTLSECAKHFNVSYGFIYSMLDPNAMCKSMPFINDLIDEYHIGLRLILCDLPATSLHIRLARKDAQELNILRPFDPIGQLSDYMGYKMLMLDKGIKATAKICDVSATSIRAILYKDHLPKPDTIHRAFVNLNACPQLLVSFPDDELKRTFARVLNKARENGSVKASKFHTI